RTAAHELPASHVILAVPHHTVGTLLPDSAFARSAAQLASSPIITVNLWFDRSVMEEEFVALLNGRMQWAFNRSRMLGSSKEGQFVACVLSGAGDLVMLEKDELVGMALKDLGAVFPAVAGAQVRHLLVVKEMRATFAPVPGSEKFRPGTTTDIPGLFLAGDWTNTGFPATIEGAVLSGRMAAETVLADLR
ncbi:MAG: FAD-dependent oxidoreductase, partial [Bacteroidota bacterium]